MNHVLSQTIYFWSEQKEVHFKNNWLRKQSVDKSFVFFFEKWVKGRQSINLSNELFVSELEVQSKCRGRAA